MQIISYLACDIKDKKKQLRNVFIEASNKSFASSEEEEDFFQKWTSYYFKHEPSCIFVAVENNMVIGYIMGSLNSHQALTLDGENLVGLSTFEELFNDFPSHLHINFKSKYQGQGLGSRLIDTFENHLKENNIAGVHIVTAPQARNVSFYKKNGFSFQKEKPFLSQSLLFMGKTI